MHNMKYPMDHKIKRPFVYVPANSTDISRTFERVRKEQARAEAESVAKVRQIKRKEKP